MSTRPSCFFFSLSNFCNRSTTAWPSDRTSSLGRWPDASRRVLYRLVTSWSTKSDFLFFFFFFFEFWCFEFLFSITEEVAPFAETVHRVSFCPSPFARCLFLNSARLKRTRGQKDPRCTDEIRGMNFKYDFAHQRRGLFSEKRAAGSLRGLKHGLISTVHESRRQDCFFPLQLFNSSFRVRGRSLLRRFAFFILPRIRSHDEAPFKRRELSAPGCTIVGGERAWKFQWYRRFKIWLSIFFSLSLSLGYVLFVRWLRLKMNARNERERERKKKMFNVSVKFCNFASLHVPRPVCIDRLFV